VGTRSGTIRLVALPSCDRARSHALYLELLPLVNAGRGVRLLDDAELPREVRGLERQRGTQWPGPGCETPSLPPRTGAPVVLAERFCARKTRLRLKKPDETVHGRPIDHRPRLRLQISLQVGVDRPRQWPSHHASCTRHPVCAGPGATDRHRWRRDARRSGGYDASCRTPTTDPAPPGRPRKPVDERDRRRLEFDPRLRLVHPEGGLHANRTDIGTHTHCSRSGPIPQRCLPRQSPIEWYCALDR
jgi:hypothetical protein